MKTLGSAVLARVLAFAVGLFCAGSAWAQLGPPSGQSVLNQARSGAALTKSDATVLLPTRGVFIGDAAACDIAVLFADDTAAVTLNNVQPGIAYPFQIKKLMSTNTTCTTVKGLW